MTRPLPSRLYHFTCDHGAEGIRRDRAVKPLELVAGMTPDRLELIPPEARWLSGVIWLTDLAALPSRHALGLTSYHLLCDRTANRFEVAAHPDRVAWWPAFCSEGIREGRLPAEARELSFTPGAMPATWWVARVPLQVQP